MKDIYKMANNLNQNILNTGLDYQSEPTILKKTLSPNLLENENLKTFLNYIDTIVVNNIESVKKIRIHNNFTVDKNTYYIN